MHFIFIMECISKHYVMFIYNKPQEVAFLESDVGFTSTKRLNKKSSIDFLLYIRRLTKE